MKKLSVIFFSLFYLQTVVGISISIHYCSGRIEYLKVFTDLGNCNHEHDEDKDSCCDEKTFYYQNISEQVLIHHWRFSFENCISGLREIYNDNGLILQGKKIVDGNDCLAPPGTRPLWLLNCSPVFYG